MSWFSAVRRHPLLFFILVTGCLVAGMILVIQSATFARALKRVAARHMPSNLGIDGDFSEFSVRFFPPGLSVRNPTIHVRRNNVADLPAGSSVTAERIDFIFLPFQMFSGNIRVHEVVIQSGRIDLVIDPAAFDKREKKKRGFKSDFHWDELLQIHAEAVAMRNTQVTVRSVEGAATKERVEGSLFARYLRLGQWTGQPRAIGYELEADLASIEGRFKDFALPSPISNVRASARVNALGLEVRELAIQDPALRLASSGQVAGNILNPKALQAEAEVRIASDLARAVTALPEREARKWDRKLGGDIEFRGKVRGDLLKGLSGLRGNGVLIGKDVHLGDFRFDDVSAEGEYDDGELRLKRATIASAEKAKQGGRQPGWGGRVEIGAVRVPTSLESTGSVSVPVRFERAHLHWLLASELKTAYPVGLRVTGPATIEFHPAKGSGKSREPWHADAQVKLDVIDFQLDNQRLGETHPLMRIFQIPKIEIEGGASFDASGIRPQNIALGVGSHSKAHVSGTIDFDKGLDLRASAALNLDDVRQIAENDIHGEGTANAHVHGPYSRILADIDLDVRNGSYISLALGDLRGRLTYDDAASHLVFSDMHATRGKTTYVGDGVVDLGQSTIALSINVPQGQIQDLMPIFERQTRDLSWLPRTLTGATSGTIEIGGGLSLDKLEVIANLSGANWDYWGERFKTVSARGGYDKGRYFLSDARAAKVVGRFTGSISYDKDEKLDWSLETQELALSDLDRVARLDVPIRGQLKVKSAGKGRMGAIESTTTASLTELAVRGVGLPPSQLELVTREGLVRGKATALGGQGVAELFYDWKLGARSSLKGELRHLDFSPALLLLNPKSIQDPALAGFASGTLDLSFRTGELERASGTVALEEYVLARTGTRFSLADPVELQIREGSFAERVIALRGPAGAATLSVSGREAELEGRLSGSLDASISEFFTPVIAKANGPVNLDFALGGTVKAPVISGRAKMAGVTARIAALESPFENGTGTIALRGNTLTLQSLECDLAGGRVTAEGTIDLFSDRAPHLNLRSSLSGNRLKIWPFQFVKTFGWITARGDSLPYLVEGQINIDSAFSKERLGGTGATGGGLQSARYAPPPGARQDADYPLFKLSIDTVADRGVLVKNDLFDVELKGNLKIINTLDAPRIVGTAELVQGKMIFKDRVFQVQSASANFDNPAVINPAFNLTAATDVSNTNVRFFASGRPTDYKIELTSNPVMPEAEILSLLATGISSSDPRKTAQGADSSEAAALILHSLEFNREVQSKTGFQIQIDESVNSQVGTSAFRAQSTVNENVAAPKITLRRQIGKRLGVAVGSTLGVGTSTQREVNAEFQVTPGFSVIGVWDNYGTTEGTTQDQESYGVDLRVQKRFK